MVTEDPKAPKAPKKQASSFWQHLWNRLGSLIYFWNKEMRLDEQKQGMVNWKRTENLKRRTKVTQNKCVRVFSKERGAKVEGTHKFGFLFGKERGI